MRIIETKVYTIEEHPNKEKCFEWIRNNWHDLNDYSVNEVIDSIKALQEEIGGDLDYSISSVPDQGEFIRLTDYNKESLRKLIPEYYPLTGVCWDADLIESMQKYGNANKVLESLHSNTDYLYSNEGLLELCVVNEYEFTENGDRKI